MKIREMMKLQKVVGLCVLAALTVLSLRGSPLPTGAAQEGQRQGRGRMFKPQADTPTPPAADAQPVTLDDEAQAALVRILTVKHAAPNSFDNRSISFDVAENGHHFTPDETPAFPDGVPAFGAEFITEGYLYPVGTLNGSNGVNPDGSPEFPNKVIGHWVCRGWHVGEGDTPPKALG